MDTQFNKQHGALLQAGALCIREIQESGATLDGKHELASVRRRSYLFVACILLTLAIFWAPLHEILAFAANSEFSYIPLIPIIAVFLVAIRRHSIFADSRPSPVAGGLIALAGILLWSLAELFPALRSVYELSLLALAVVTTWWGLFFLAYGSRAARKALLPLCLLLFMVPAPQGATDQIIASLQHGSAVMAYSLFSIIGVPAIRDGMTISLPHLTIEVGPECSGIRSTVSLLILTLAGANLYLRSTYNKILLVSLLIPLSVLKNAIRIVTLSTLAIYVDPIIIKGPIHRRGGILFFFIAFAMLLPVVILMRHFERRSEHAVDV
jgi:exosortase